MEYKTGSYIMVGRKFWPCFCCKKSIPPGEKSFVRVVEDKKESFDAQGVKYHRKNYSRWHIECALALRDLNQYEKGLLSFYFLQPQSRLEAPGATNYVKEALEAAKVEK
jgi:hypothetical protein